MLNNLLALIKETTAGMVSENKEIPKDKKEQVIETTTQAFTDGLKQNISLDNLSNLTGLFKKGVDPVSNPLTANIQNSVAEALVNRANLSQGVAGTLASSVVPLIISVVSNRLNDPNGKGFELKSLLNDIWGKEDKQEESNEDDKKSLLDRITDFFGHKS